MQAIIIFITLLGLLVLSIGFLEIKIPFLFDDLVRRFNLSHKKLSKHTRKMMHKRMWNSETHKGFVKLPI